MSGPSNRTHTGQGATEKVREFFHGRDIRDTAAHFTKWLDNEGFIIVPKPYKAPARRGNSKPPAYTGPELIGKSHTARLVGGASS